MPEEPTRLVHTARFTVRPGAIGGTTRTIAVALAVPLEIGAPGDSEFELFQVRALNAHHLAGALPAELQPYRGWRIIDVQPGD